MYDILFATDVRSLRSGVPETSDVSASLGVEVTRTGWRRPGNFHRVSTTEMLFSEDSEGEFYQTIIRNNLFAPLGTVLNPPPILGENLMLLATFLREAPAMSTALIKNRTTGRQHTIAVGESVGDFRLTEVQSKNVTLSHNGETARLALSPIFFLNSKRR